MKQQELTIHSMSLSTGIETEPFECFTPQRLQAGGRSIPEYAGPTQGVDHARAFRQVARCTQRTRKIPQSGGVVSPWCGLHDCRGPATGLQQLIGEK